MHSSIKPGTPWLDTNGNRIQAHGGSLFYEADTFYWYGENKERTRPGNGIWHWGIRCYSSTDLYNWTDLGLIVPPEPDDPDSPLHPSKLVDRPHIVKDPRTGKYICWLKVMRHGQTVLTADSLLGPYTIVSSGWSPLGMNAGDFDLVLAPDDHKGYYYFGRSHTEMICADLNDDYTDVTGYYSTHMPRVQPPDAREAPAYFRRRGKHYLITSGTTGYFPNPSEVAVAPSYHGPFESLGNVHPSDASSTSFRSQISSVFAHPTVPDLYIAVADRWIPGATPADSDHRETFRRYFAGEDLSAAERDALKASFEADTSQADYVWLPLRFDGDRVLIEWLDEWRVEDFQ